MREVNSAGSTRDDFRSCSVFTDSRSVESILAACDFPSGRYEERLSVLEAFSGDGIVADAISSHLRNSGVRHSLTAAEIDLNHLERVSPHHQKLKIDLTKDSLPEEYDCIVIRYGLHDLSLRDKSEAITNLVAHLKPRGRFVITDIMPDPEDATWLQDHHQQKEDLTHGINRNVYLAHLETYVELLRANNVDGRLLDCFYQEVFIRDWVGSFGTSNDIIGKIEKKVLNAPEEIKKRLFIFDHPEKGARLYYPISTIGGNRYGSSNPH